MNARCDTALSFPVRAIFLLAAALVLASLISAQQPVSPITIWQGQLHNSSGAPLEGARIRLIGESNSATALTGPDGTFRIQVPAPGAYKLTVDANGRSAGYATMIDVQPGAHAVSIGISDRGEITVAGLKERSAATGGEALSSDAVSQLPLNKRDFSQLLLLAAGTMTDANGATNFTQQFAINGQRGVEATFAMDGADISDPEMGGSTFSNFNVDAVEGIESSSGWMPAEIGRRVHQHHHAFRRQRLSWLGLRVCPQLGV